MVIFLLTLLILGIECQYPGTPKLLNINEMPEAANYDDAQHRGPRWYDYKSDQTTSSEYKDESPTSSASSEDSDSTHSDSSSASSYETQEKKQATKVYRVCTPCPEDMLKKYTNLGIKWICAGYQRARRSFKSECMMRYRNCEDGTMFVRVHNNRCRNDTYHGRHFFYDYKV